MLVALIGMSVLGTWSCNNEELYEEPVAVVEDESNEDVDDAVTDVNSLCDFTLENLEANSTVVVNCIIDLQGESLDLPENVTLLYEGGDIINGTLVFSEGSSIDGDLLGNTLEVGGTKPALRDTAFTFDPKRWGIIEGIVSDEVARNNRDILENTMILAKEYGIDTFKIDEMDAYFNVVEIKANYRPSQAGITLPSDLHLIMSDNTNLRVQPNNYKTVALLGFYLTDNVIVEGGNLYGDRDSHDYSDGGTHEWGHTITLDGSKNITIKNVKSFNATGDGISIGSYGHAYDSHYRYCDNILITGNTISKNRRNGISIGDGRNIVIDNNTFIDNGVDTALSKGTQPRMAIDVEPANSGGVIFQIANNITISNNTESGAQSLSFYIASGNDILIENNNTEGSISYWHAYNCIIRNNTITGVTEAHKIQTGISCGSHALETSNYNNKIYGNKVTGYLIGLSVVSRDIEVYENEFIDCFEGIALSELYDSKIYKNIITSSVPRSRGITTKIPAKILNNVIISENKIDVVLSAFGFYDINLDNDDYKFEIINNDVKSEGTSGLSLLNGLTFNNNIVDGGLRLVGTLNSVISNNTISTNGAIGIDLSSLNDNIEVFGNMVSIEGSASV
ncbi:phage protein [Algibacter lectus]|uniref:Phage protein n=2 Tax=Algibacter lectus TaxID=221126 RepID=A0A090VJI4_9FLAO|nr:phage protein [Algibacter lectus]